MMEVLQERPFIALLDDNPVVSRFSSELQSNQLCAFQPVRYPGCLVRNVYKALVPLKADMALLLWDVLGVPVHLPPPSHICIKRYVFNEGEMVQNFDRLHVDRSRVNNGCLMKRTAIIYMDDHSGTVFPFICENGLTINSKKNRLLVFSSLEEWESAHQGINTGNAETRTIGIIGWDGMDYDLGGHHEMLEQETPEVRASFFGRTLEEELVGWVNGPRSGEAIYRLREIANRRHTTVDRLIQEERERANLEPIHTQLLHITRKFYPKRSTLVTQAPVYPKVVYEAIECPVCQDDEVELKVMTCGHKICRACFDHIRSVGYPICTDGSPKCPHCRVPSSTIFDVALCEPMNA